MDIEDNVGKDLKALADALNSGADLEAVDPVELKSLWGIVRKVGRGLPGQQIAIGVDGIVAASPTHREPSAREMMTLMARATVLSALLDRGVLNEFEENGELNDVVFRAAATMAVNACDLGQATLQTQLAKLSAEEAEKLNSELAGQLTIDAKFLAAIRAARE